MATKMVLACSHSRSLQLLARLDARTEFKILEPSLKGGVEAGRAHHCTALCTTSFHPPLARFQIRYAHPISLGCHQLYIVTVASAYACTQGPFWLLGIIEL